ncbi:MAG: serine/threonine-protein kinase [Gammaproteobacteria bacterium]|nr:serine/threonine-protein kinase [Gammaproteobacteria bacterium]
MSDRDHNDDAGFDDKTAARQEPNGEKTVVRGSRSAESGEEPAGGEADSTLVRGQGGGKTPVPAGNEDATIVRDDPATPSGQEVDDAGPTGSDSDTIVRGPAESSSSEGLSNDNATILRGAGGATDENSTIPRGSNPSNEHATILRGARGSEDSTVLRDGGSDRDDGTVMRDGGSAGDDDSTIINANRDDDATTMGDRERGEDTTYVATQAAGGRSERSNKGNSEAGRLLKNRFVLEEKIGSGGMGDVYKALDLRQQEAQERNPYIAIKILNEEFARHKDAFMSLQREATRTRGIPHPNIMAVYDFDREGDTVFMSMELLDGQPLDDYLRAHPEGVSVEDAWQIIDGICQGLSRAHGAGIVHSDFKPGNIYYAGDKTAKVFDFGIARAVANPGELKADGEKTVFDAGSLGALTPTYASYEMLVGKDPTKSDDVYAVALVAYELFTGRHPYDRTPADKALERGLEPEPVPFLKRRQWRALKKGLALTAEDRYHSIDEFHADMFSEGLPVFRYAAVAAVLIASVGFGVYNFFYGTEELPKEYQQLTSRLDGSKSVLKDELGPLGESVDALRRGEVTLNNSTINWNFSSADWRDSIRVNLSRLRGLDLELKEKFSEYYEFGENSDPEVQAWKDRGARCLHCRNFRDS